MKSVKQVMGETKLPHLIFLREETCECGPVAVYQMEHILGPYKGQTFETKIGCRCEEKRMAEQALKAREEAKKRKIQQIFDRYSLIPDELLGRTLDDYLPQTKKQAVAKKTAERYIDIFSVENPRNIVFSGTFGVGKSHLAKCITDGVIEKGFSAIYISVPKLLRKFRGTYHKESDYSEDELTQALEETDLLVLDDIGAESDSKWAKEKLFDVIDSRQGKSTIYTTNYSPEDLLEIMGERNFSRVFNRNTAYVEVDGENYRLADILK